MTSNAAGGSASNRVMSGLPVVGDCLRGVARVAAVRHGSGARERPELAERVVLLGAGGDLVGGDHGKRGIVSVRDQPERIPEGILALGEFADAILLT